MPCLPFSLLCFSLSEEYGIYIYTYIRYIFFMPSCGEKVIYLGGNWISGISLRIGSCLYVGSNMESPPVGTSLGPPKLSFGKTRKLFRNVVMRYFLSYCVI